MMMRNVLMLVLIVSIMQINVLDADCCAGDATITECFDAATMGQTIDEFDQMGDAMVDAGIVPNRTIEEPSFFKVCCFSVLAPIVMKYVTLKAWLTGWCYTLFSKKQAHAQTPVTITTPSEAK